MSYKIIELLWHFMPFIYANDCTKTHQKNNSCFIMQIQQFATHCKSTRNKVKRIKLLFDKIGNKMALHDKFSTLSECLRVFMWFLRSSPFDISSVLSHNFVRVVFVTCLCNNHGSFHRQHLFQYGLGNETTIREGCHC